jgi:hypothetical protein
MNASKAKRRLMQWERLHKKYPQSGRYKIGRTWMHTGHLKASVKFIYGGRSAPRGLRTPWELSRGA